MDLPTFIATERRRAGFSQRALAKMIGVSPGAVAQWETGERRPTLGRLVDLAATFGVRIDGLVGPDSPYAGALVEDPEELRLLSAWRRLPAAERTGLLALLLGRTGPPQG